jgi:hypothetical protein
MPPPAAPVRKGDVCLFLSSGCFRFLLEKYKEALKYYELLRATMAADNELRESVLQVMRGIYLRLGNTEKYQEVNAELQAM